MNVERAELFLLPLRLREPFRSSRGATHDRPVLLIALHGEGVVGWGECVAQAAPSYSHETVETAWHVLTEWILPAVVGHEHASAAAVACATGWIRGHPMARGAVEMAAWDLAAKRSGLPLHEALGGERRPVPAGIALGLEPDDEAVVERVGAALARGYRRVKLKIEPGRDLTLLRAVRERFPDAPLSADANGAYTLDDLPPPREIDALGLLMLEQPLPPEDLLGHARLQATLATPVCLDESIGSAATARLALELGSCSVINVKPGRVGGLGPAREIHDLCRMRGVPVWCGGMLESGIGRAHDVALATLPGFTLPGDLSPSDRYWERDLVHPEWRMSDGALVPPMGPGIGVEPDRRWIERAAVSRHTL